MTKPTQAQTLLAASLMADSLAMPAHWIYDPAAIEGKFGRITDLVAPQADGYHKAQPAGGQTHYGDQALQLMDSLTHTHLYKDEDFAGRWAAMWDGYPGYVDGATRETLANLKEGKLFSQAGSSSSDLGGASRIAALVVAMRDASNADYEAAVVSQTELTHRDPETVEAALFLARAARAALHGADTVSAIAAAAGMPYEILPAHQRVEAAKKAAAAGSTTEAVQALGAACSVQQALPAALAIAFTHPTDLEAALIANVAAGGDSAARGLALGLLIGGTPGASVPTRWLDQWQAKPHYDAFLQSQALALV